MNKPIILIVNKLPFNFSGFSFYPFIVIERKQLTFKLLKHEFIHFLQAKRMTAIIFFIRYFIQLILVGYKLNIFELEANGQIKPQIKTKNKVKIN